LLGERLEGSAPLISDFTIHIFIANHITNTLNNTINVVIWLAIW